MGRKIRITEEQYNMALKEGVTINADLGAANNDPKKAYDAAKTEADKQGLKSGEYRPLSLKEVKRLYGLK